MKIADQCSAFIRYLGTDPEPRPGLSSGHIPHSFSLPFNVFLQTHSLPNSSTQYTTYLLPSEIHRALVDAIGAEQAESIIKGERPVITSCGSGMTAGILWLGLKLLGVDKVGLYDEVSLFWRKNDVSQLICKMSQVLDWVCRPRIKCNWKIAVTVHIDPSQCIFFLRQMNVNSCIPNEKM